MRHSPVSFTTWLRYSRDMAIMDLVRDITPTGELNLAAIAAAGASTVTCADCGMNGGSVAPMSWSFTRTRGRVQRHCPECVRLNLHEIETFVSH